MEQPPSEPVSAAETDEEKAAASDDAGPETCDTEALAEIENTPPHEWVKKYGGYMAVAAFVGAVGYGLYKKGRGRIDTPESKITISSGIPRMPGIVSFVQRTGEGGGKPSDLSISLPEGEEAAKTLESGSKALFAMQLRSPRGEADEGHVSFAFPLRKDEKHISKYADGVRTIAGWLRAALQRDA